MPEDPKSPLDQLLDLVLYAPIGLAKTVADSLPELVAKGRKEFETQTTTARLMGQYAVKEAQKNARRRTGTPRPAAAAAPRREAAGSEAAGSEAGPAAEAPAANGKATGAGAAAAGRAAPPAPAVDGAAPAPAPAAAEPPAPTSGHLAIPGYDTLSASQVVQRLAGLAADELEAVRAYEEATRGRRTILSKIGQLQADRT